MSGSLRSTARNPIAVAMMGLLTLVFLVLGVSGGGGRFPDLFKGINANDVITAGQHTVSAQTFKRLWDDRKQQDDQQRGQPAPLDMLIQAGADQQMLSGVAQEQSVLEVLRRAGVVPADSLIDDEIRKIPWAFNPVTGQFDQKQYTDRLAQQGMTPRDAQVQFKDTLAFRHYGFAVQAGFKMPRLFSAITAVQVLENRDVSFFVMDKSAVPAPAAPTDAQLIAFMNQHKDALTIPETRQITLVRFSSKPLEASMVVSPADVQKEFDFKKDSLSTPETRSFVQIPVKSPAQAADAAARLQRGEDPAAVARAESATPIGYEDKPKSALPDTKIAAAAFGLGNGAVSGPIQGDLSLSVIKITKITPGHEATLDTARPQIEAELRTRMAEDKVAEATLAFQTARDGGSSLADAAQKVGAVAVPVGPIRADGTDLHGQPIPGLDPKIVKAAFAEPAGGSGTDVTKTTPGEYYALKVEKVLPPSLPPLAEIRVALAQEYVREALIDALKAKADTLMGQMRHGGTIEAAAAQVGAHVTHQVGLQRGNARQYAQTLGRDFLVSIFGAKPGDVFDAGGQQGIFIAKLDAVRTADVTQTAQVVQQVGPRASQAYMEDIDSALRNYAQATIKPNTNIDLARRAIGVSQETIDKLAAQAKPAAGKPAAAPARKAGPAA